MQPNLHLTVARVYVTFVFERKDGDIPVGRWLPEGKIERETLCVVCCDREADACRERKIETEERGIGD